MTFSEQDVILSIFMLVVVVICASLANEFRHIKITRKRKK